MPVMGQATLESIELMASSCQAFVDFCVAEMEANEERCKAAVEQSLSMATSLNPYIGYDRTTKLVKEAFATDQTIRALCVEQRVLEEDQLNEALDPWRMTEPQG